MLQEGLASFQGALQAIRGFLRIVSLRMVTLVSPESTPVFFVIPLVAKASCNDWSVVESNLDRTLSTIAGKHDGVHIYVVGHDEPAGNFLSHPQVSFLPVSWPIPKSVSEKRADKHMKRRFAGVEIRKMLSKPAIFFCLDADDLVHHQLVPVLRRLSRSPGVLQGGWVLDVRARLCTERRNMNRISGSTLFGTFHPHELPFNPHDSGALYSWLFEGPHATLQLRAKARGLRTQTIQKPLVAYVINHPESLQNEAIGGQRTHMKAPHSRDLEEAAQEIRANFGINVATL